MNKEPIYKQGVVSEVLFPNRGKMIPTAEDSAAGILTNETNPAISVKNVLPGQTIKVSVGHKGKRRREGRLIELIERAPYEIEPRCPHAATCGGCSYQTVPYQIQTQWKQQQVEALMRPVTEGIDTEYMPIATSPLEHGYRNKMEYSWGDEYKDGPLSLGLHKRGAFHDVITTDHCTIVHPDFNTILKSSLEYWSAAGVSYVSKFTHQGYLRHLVMRRSYMDGSLLINLVTSSEKGPDLTGWVEALKNLPLEGYIRGILHTTNDSVADVVQNQGLEILYGQDSLIEQLFDLRFEIFPFSFFQTNSKGAEVLYSVVREMAGDVSGQTVFDLYCGTGTIAQIMAGAGASSVTGIEIVEEAVDAAVRNAALNGLDNCSFIAGDVLKQVENLTEHPDLIILDPPRDGIHPKALPKILSYAPDRFIYVSCKPTSLARDIPMFREAGYEPVIIKPVDMFPQTVHVETVCLLKKVR